MRLPRACGRVLAPALFALLNFTLSSTLAAHAQTYSVTGVVDLNPSGSSSSQALGASGGAQAGYALGSDFYDHAFLWTGSAGAAVSLQPTNLGGFSNSLAEGVAGSGATPSVVGYGIYNGANFHALLWHGTANSTVDLQPVSLSGITDSYAQAVSGGTQVGYGTDAGGSDHALLWTGTAASATDLTPMGYTDAHAEGIAGGVQVGYGTSGGAAHALMWNGSAASFTDLQPTNLGGLTSSFAYGVSGSGATLSIVGYGLDAGNKGHALLWKGRATTAVDLTPTKLSGFNGSFAYAASGAAQVGYGTNAGGSDHALLWTGSADSALDLNASLPAGFGASSQALGVSDNADGTLTVVGFGENSGGGTHAFAWQLSQIAPTPEPAGWIILGLGGLGLGGLGLRARRRA